jgi:hypothetical protein
MHIYIFILVPTACLVASHIPPRHATVDRVWPAGGVWQATEHPQIFLDFLVLKIVRIEWE